VHHCAILNGMKCRALAAAAIVVGALASAPAAMADWPLYGHDLANSRNAGADGPAPEQVGALQQAWAFRSPTGDFTGTPVIADGILVAGDHGGSIYALDAVTGEVKWSKQVGHPINGTAAIDVNTPGGPTVFVPVAELGGPRLLALSLADGATRWDAELSNQPDASVYGSPVFWRGTVYTGTSGPNNDDSTARGSVVALDEASGRIRWQTFTVPPGRDGAAVWTTPAIDRSTGRLYVGTGNNYHPPTTETGDAMLVLDTTTGRILAGYQATAGDTFAADNPTGPDYDFGASPNLFTGPDGQRLVGEGQKSGIYWALDRATMMPVWNTRVGPGGILGGSLGSTAFDGTRIYATDTIDGNVTALGRDGAIAWQSPDAGGAHLAPTAVANGVVYTNDPSGFTNARDATTGAILGKLPLGATSFGGVSAVGGAVYVSVGTGPPPQPAPQQVNPGSIVAFGDTSRSGGLSPRTPARPGAQRRPRIRLSVRPRRVRAQRRVALRFRARRGARPLRGVRIRLATRRVRTNRKGRATMRLRFRRSGVRVAHASRRGLRSGRARVRVVTGARR
jgi:polyvinyl alcohol dehydrogenase (cytochrome)